MKITNNGPQTIGQIARYFEHGDLFLSPEEYQRETAWDLKQKKLLIDSIFTGFDLPKFYLWRIDQRTLSHGYPDGEMKAYYRNILEKKRRDNDEDDPCVYEVVDGQQRIRTFLEYMGIKPPNDKCYRGSWLNPFTAQPDTPIAKGKKFNELNANQQLKFEQYSLSIVVLEDSTIDEIRDMFLRLQNGTPLNAQQKRDALGSNIGQAARELAGKPFFTTSVSFPNTSSEHNLVASQILRLELRGDIASCTSQQLDKLYEDYKKVQVDANVLSRAHNIVKILGEIFPSKNQHLNQNYALSLYWLLSRILLIYEIPQSEYSKIRDNFERMDIERIEARERDYSKPGDKKFEDLSLAMSRGNLGVEAITTRHKIIGLFLFNGVNLVERPRLDPKRSFTFEEKLLLYYKSGGKCQLEHNGIVCNREIDFDDAVVDHIIPHSLGGRTELSNGRIAHKACNIARGNRKDFDPQKDCCYYSNGKSP